MQINYRRPGNKSDALSSYIIMDALIALITRRSEGGGSGRTWFANYAVVALERPSSSAVEVDSLVAVTLEAAPRPCSSRNPEIDVCNGVATESHGHCGSSAILPAACEWMVATTAAGSRELLVIGSCTAEQSGDVCDMCGCEPCVDASGCALGYGCRVQTVSIWMCVLRGRTHGPDFADN